jgi:hypothetical protein
MMNREIKIITNCFLGVVVMLLLVTCASRPQSIAPNGTSQGAGNSPTQTAAPNGTAQTVRSYRSNGERIYFSSTSDRGTNITYTGGPSFDGRMGNGNGHPSSGSTGGGYGGMMGNGSSGRMGGDFLTCASCHGSDGRGGVNTRMGMQTINAKDIRWSALKNELMPKNFVWH